MCVCLIGRLEIDMMCTVCIKHVLIVRYQCARQVGLDRIFTEKDGEPWAGVFLPSLGGSLDALLGKDRYVTLSFHFIM